MSEFKFPATLSGGNGKQVVTAFNANSSAPIYVADEFHPAFEDILKGLRAGDPNVWSLFEVGKGVVSKFRSVTERVSWNGSEVLWDGSPIHTALSEQLSRALREGDERNYTAMARFWEKLEANPDENSRKQAYDFLACHEFQITEDGDVVGYKGVRDAQEDGVYYSTWASQVPDVPSGFVNGAPIAPLSQIPQKIGDVVTMPREQVSNDPYVLCSRGLHVSTHDYASSYGNKVMLVTFSPANICAVPNDAQGEKVRVWKYKVKGLATERNSDSVVLREEAEARWTGVGYTPM